MIYDHFLSRSASRGNEKFFTEIAGVKMWVLRIEGDI
jgi:hypothetical protein